MLSLYRAKPDDGVVVCFDEMGPIQLIPHHGSGWAPAGVPERLRATYNRKARAARATSTAPSTSTTIA